MSAVKLLIQQIKDASSHSLKTRETTENKQEALLKEISVKLRKNYRPPWKLCGQKETQEDVKPLKNRPLSNWQISRMPLSKRSYCAPKNFKGVKIPSKNRQFSSVEPRDKEGHLPYLYESQIGKLQRLRSAIKKPYFAPVRSSPGLFGMEKLRYSRAETNYESASFQKS